MKLLLLKTLLQRRARDEGFTLPMVIALGLVMLLLAAVSITTANEENLTAITQNSKSDALAIAEIGVAQYREMLDKNRILTIYNRAQWTSNDVSGVNVVGQNCDVISGTGNGWASKEPANTTFSAANWRAVKLDETIVGKDLNNDGDSTDTDATIGWYKIVDYEYDNDRTLADNDDDGIFSVISDVNKDDDPLTLAPGVTANSITDENDINDDGISDTKGILTVKGRSSDGSEAQIQVEIPIRINLDDMTNLAPALWIGNSGITATNLGNLTIGNGNVVIKDQASADGCSGFSSLASAITTTSPGTVISDSRDLPLIKKISNPTATVPADFGDVEKARTGLSIPTGSPINNLPLTVSETTTNDAGEVATVYKKVIFGSAADKGYNLNAVSPNLPTDCSSTKVKLCRYYYDPPETTELIYTDTDLLTDGVARTTLLLNRPLTIKATNTAITGQNVKIGSTSPVANDSNSFEIYVNGNHDITIDVASGRTVTINGFIHAPESTLTITGDGIVNINGSVWVNDFDNSDGATVNISPDTISREPTPDNPSTSGKGYEFYSTTASRTPRPITGSPTNWKTEKVD